MSAKSSSLSHRERVKIALRHQEPDRIPLANVMIQFSRIYPELDAYVRQEKQVPIAEYCRPLQDVVWLTPRYIGPALPDGTDIWGVRRKWVSFGSGGNWEITDCPLERISKMEEVLRYAWPNPDCYDFSELPQMIAKANGNDEDYFILVKGGNIFECAYFLRNLENAYIDMADGSELFRAVMQKVTDFFCGYVQRVLEVGRGRIDMIFTADDLGSQRGPLISAQTYRDWFLPFHRQQHALCHKYGASVMYHSCGSVMPLLPQLIESGVDVLQSLQFDSRGMDPAALKAQFGCQLCFDGGISVQTTLPFGRPEEVRHETRERIRVLGKNGGYLAGPTHEIQDNTPPENVLAMLDEIARHRY